MRLSKIKKRILANCAEDDMGLWLLVIYVTQRKFVAFEDIPDNAKKQVLKIIKDLLQDELIEAGNPNGPRFAKLLGTNDEIVKFIEEEWKRLGKQPNIADICWFRATSRGLQVAKDLKLSI